MLVEISSNPYKFFVFNALIIEIISLVENVGITRDGGETTLFCFK
jgi:hypothetical protein